jgi:hypothetical protein
MKLSELIPYKAYFTKRYGGYIFIPIDIGKRLIGKGMYMQSPFNSFTEGPISNSDFWKEGEPYQLSEKQIASLPTHLQNEVRNVNNNMSYNIWN